MKTILKTIWLFFSLTALSWAGSNYFAFLENQAGGFIVITLDTCALPNHGSMQRVFYYTKTGETEEGCWEYKDEFISAIWEKTERKLYPIKWFTLDKPYSGFKK